MSTKLDALRQRNKNSIPVPNDRNPLNSIPPPQLAFGDDTNPSSTTASAITNTPSQSLSDNNNTRKRYVARIKNVCMAIPFNSNETLLSFQDAVLSRASSHRKLQKQLKLSKRVQYIKLATPHFPQLVDCHPQDKLCEIATESDMIVFHTPSDDEKEEQIVRYTKNIQSIHVPPYNSKDVVSPKHSKSHKSDKKKKKDSSNKRKSAVRPHTAKYVSSSPWDNKTSITPTPSSSSSSSSSTSKLHESSTKSKRKSMTVRTGSGALSKNNTASAAYDGKKEKENKKKTMRSINTTTGTNSFGTTGRKKKDRRNLSADLPESVTNAIDLDIKRRNNNNKKHNKLKPKSVETSPQISPEISPVKSSPNLMHRVMKQSKSGGDIEENDGNESDRSDRSGYSGHSGYASDENRDFDISDNNNNNNNGSKLKPKKKNKNKSNDVEEFAKQVMDARRKGKKRDFDRDEELERLGRKNRATSHGRSISLSGAAMLHSGDNKKKGNKSKKKESIYASNVQSKSSKSSKRSNAFEYFSSSSSRSKPSKPKMSIDQEKRKIRYRYGNRNINVIRPSIIPYEEEQDQVPEYYLDLEYIHGYDGYAMESRQNMFLSHDAKELIYPMARTGIMLNLDNNKQRHWMDGREPISSIAIHPEAPIIVTGHVQKGPDRAKIRVWNYKTFVLHKLIKKMHDAAVLCCQWSKHSGYLYTIGAQEMHKCILWNATDLFKLDIKHGNKLQDGIDHEDVISADVTSKKKNFINCPIDIVSDILLGKQDILGFEINPYIAIDDEKDGLIDEFVAFGRKNVKYYEVKSRIERRNGRNVELVLPSPKTLVMSKLGGKSSEYERIYQSCCWLKNSPSWYLLGGHTGTIYICYKASCLKKLTSFGLTSCIGCIINIITSPNVVFVGCWDGKLLQLNVSSINNLKIKKVKERMIYVPRSGDEETGLKTQSPRTMLYDLTRNLLYIGLRTNQIISLNMNILFKEKSNNQLHGTLLLLDSHYGYVQCLAAHPFEPYYVTGSDDSTLRIWDISNRQCLSRFKFDEREKPSYLRFSHSGYLLAVGLTTSKIVILAWRDCNLSEVKAVVQMPFKIDKSLKKSQQLDAKNSEFTTDITVIKWSSDDLNFAAGHIDAIAHIFSIKYFNNDPTDESSVFDYNLDIKPWDSSLDVSNGLIDIQWSLDNQWLLTFTKDQDLMVWFLNREKYIFEHYLYWLDPDKIEFHGDPLLAGWDTEGIFQSYIGWDGTDLNAVSITTKQFKKTSPINDIDLIAANIKQQYKSKLLASADNKGYIRIHNYPALKEQSHHYYSGHANQVKQVQWTSNDQYLISVGGSDRSVFQWKLTNQETDYIKKYKPLKSTNQFKR